MSGPAAPDLGLADFCGTARRALLAAELESPRAGEVTVVLFETAGWMTQLPAALILLGPAERARADRFRFARDRARYVLAHALWRVVLARCLDVEPAAVPLQFAPSGQPRLPGTPFATSLSHSGNAVLIGIGRVATLGVDIERTPPRIPLEGMMATLCAAEESVALQELPGAIREQALLQLWTRKEALLKAFGVGLTYPPTTFSAVPGVPVKAPPGTDWPACCVHDLLLPNGNLGSLAAPEGVASPVVRVIDSGVHGC